MRAIGALLLGLALGACITGERPEWRPGNTPRAQPASAPPPAAQSEPAPAPAPVAAPPVAASNVAAPAAPGPRASGDEEVVVSGAQQRQVPAPADPRTTEQRMADIRAWDQCVMRLQGRAENATEPQLDSPEEVCRR